MSIQKMLLFIGLCALITGCASEKYGAYDMFALGESGTDKGVRYLLGRGVPQDDEKAFYYFHQAAKNNDPFAQNEVAYMYAAAKGTTRNYEKALLYYQKAASHGLASAQYNLGMMYAYGLGTPANKVEALKWFKKSARLGFEPAQVALTQYKS